ncbi:acyl-CoA dehydrogenase family protein [Granulicoccus phenolivorans]|uniref:acyl-CoA dehydrogenase family protein n=1 Tax=Granulicoccus phenolivorans TaxID=266854 RepID=UPI000412EB85|nr:acyl-CoA dehydrogenase family protein [Granulicoccus phenolivorans]
MRIALTDQEQELQDRATEYFSSAMTEDERAAMTQDFYGPQIKDIARRLGRDGWLGLGWPTEHGGRALGPMADQIVISTSFRYEVPYPLITVYSIGPALMAFGSEELKADFLPRILSGDVQFSVGYSEPGSGTDLASLRTRAVRDGDDYVVNGTKMWTSGAHTSDYLFLAVRTNPEEPRHRGISLLLLDTKLPGVSMTPMRLLNRSRQVNVVNLDNVRIPARMLVGEENKGWRVITNQLNSERFTVGPSGKIDAHLDRVRAWAQTAQTADGRPVRDIAEVRRLIGRLQAAEVTNRMMNWRVVGDAAGGSVPPADAAATKLYNSEQLCEFGQLIGEVVGRVGDPSDKATRHLLDETYFSYTHELRLPVGGGVSEIQREFLATLGLGLPKVIR